VDATVHSGLAQKYGVSGYPTIKVFAKGPKGEPTEYQGGRDSDAIVKEALGLLGEKPVEEPTSVITLTDADFDEQVLKSGDLWLVEFFAPWCGHCKSLAPEWRTAANQLEGRVKMAAVDVTVSRALGERFEIKSFPTIKVFGADKLEPTEFNGGRTSGAIVSAAEDLLKDMSTPARSVIQLTDNAVLQEQCATDLCVVAFLPHILDAGREGRQTDLAILAAEAQRTKKQNIGFLWSEAAAQPELERALDIGEANYPSLSMISMKKSLRIPFVSAFTTEAVSGFIKRASSGKEAPIKVKSFPQLQKVVAWDGKDAPKQEL